MKRKQDEKLIYYDPRKLLATNSDFNLIIGQRGNGKTYSICKLFLDEYKRIRKRFVYVRRWADDIKGYRAEQLFEPLKDYVIKIFGDGYYIQFYRHKYYLCNEAGEKLDCIGYAVALSEAAHTKSVAFVDVKYILYDEFIQMSGESVLRDEMSKFENTLSTIIRSKTDIKVFLLANTVSKFSPYFIHFGIDINKVDQGTIITKEYPTDDKGVLRVSLEYCAYNEAIARKVSKYILSSKMITTGQWEIPETDDIPSVKGEVVKDKLLCTMYDPDADIVIGCFIRYSKWEELLLNEQTKLYYHKEHCREFLIIRQVNKKSSYYHLTDQKSLTYTMYNDISFFLRDIYDNTGIDIEHELYMGRIFSDNMFTADYFNHIWSFYGKMTPRKLL